MDYADWRAHFERLAEESGEELDIAEGALIIASDEYPHLDIEKYRIRLDTMAEHVRSHLPRDRDPKRTVEVLNRYLFGELRFSGNRENYYDPRNSYLNDVMDRKVGLPITLSIVYLSIGRRLGMPVFGVGLPGHFIVKWEDRKSRLLIDPFNRGEILDEAGVEARVRDTFHSQAQFQPEWLVTVNGKYILIRLLNNLKAIFVQAQALTRAWQVVDKLLILDPRSPENIRDMGLLSIHVKAFRKAAIYLEEYLLSHSDAADADQLRAYLGTALAAIERLN
jgi:regulator of sirC expression with transglutaminase-like and TPR domain